MKVKKTLNNSVIISKDKQGKEIIVMGKGLAFGLKTGDLIDVSRIDKIFSLNDSTEISKLQQLLTQIPEDIFNLAEELITYAKETLERELHNTIYITLTDHINTMIERANMNIYLKNTMLWDIKQIYRDEFQVALKMTEVINERFGLDFDENEAANLVLHIMNAEHDLTLSMTEKITTAISEMLEIVKCNFNLEYNEDSLSYYRFVVHLRSFVQRLFAGTIYNDSLDVDFFNHIQHKYQKSLACALLLEQHIKGKYNYILSQEERMYLTLHIEKVVRDSASQQD